MALPVTRDAVVAVLKMREQGEEEKEEEEEVSWWGLVEGWGQQGVLYSSAALGKIKAGGTFR